MAKLLYRLEGALLAALFPGAALAGPPAGSALAAWVSQTTDLMPSQIAVVGPENVYSLEPLGPPSPTGEVIVLVRTEAYDNGWGRAHGFQSWEANLLIDCKRGRLKVIRSASYPDRNRQGRPVVGSPDADWSTPKPSEPDSRLVAAACDAAFAWPLRGAPLPAKVSSPHKSTDVAAASPLPRVVELPPLPPPAEKAAAKSDKPDAKTDDKADDKAAPIQQVVDIAPEAAAPSASPPGAVAAAKPGERYFLQITRGPSEAAARKALDKARETLGPLAEGLTVRLDMTDISGRKRFTARLEGLASAQAAEDACSKLVKAKQSCFFRPLAAPAETRAKAGSASPRPPSPSRRIG